VIVESSGIGDVTGIINCFELCWGGRGDCSLVVGDIVVVESFRPVVVLWTVGGSLRSNVLIEEVQQMGRGGRQWNAHSTT